MSWVLRQTKTAIDDGPTATISATFDSNVLANSLIVASFGWSFSAGEDKTCAAGALTFTKANEVTSSPDGYGIHVFYGYGTTAGAMTVTASDWTSSSHTTPRSTTFARLIIEEFTGVGNGDPLDKTAAQRQVTPGTGTDAGTSGNTAATTVDGELVHGHFLNGGTQTQGTGFTAGTLNFNGLGTEYKTQSTAGVTAATWTLGTNQTVYTVCSTYKPLSTVLPSVNDPVTVSESVTARMSLYVPMMKLS